MLGFCAQCPSDNGHREASLGHVPRNAARLFGSGRQRGRAKQGFELAFLLSRQRFIKLALAHFPSPPFPAPILVSGHPPLYAKPPKASHHSVLAPLHAHHILVAFALD